MDDLTDVQTLVEEFAVSRIISLTGLAADQVVRVDFPDLSKSGFKLPGIQVSPEPEDMENFMNNRGYVGYGVGVHLIWKRDSGLVVPAAINVYRRKIIKGFFQQSFNLGSSVTSILCRVSPGVKAHPYPDSADVFLGELTLHFGVPETRITA